MKDKATLFTCICVFICLAGLNAMAPTICSIHTPFMVVNEMS